MQSQVFLSSLCVLTDHNIYLLLILPLTTSTAPLPTSTQAQVTQEEARATHRAEVTQVHTGKALHPLQPTYKVTGSVVCLSNSWIVTLSRTDRLYWFSSFHTSQASQIALVLFGQQLNYSILINLQILLVLSAQTAEFCCHSEPQNVLVLSGVLKNFHTVQNPQIDSLWPT